MQQLIETFCLCGRSILDLIIGSDVSILATARIGRWTCTFEGE
jgi:hypothetical protein